MDLEENNPKSFSNTFLYASTVVLLLLIVITAQIISNPLKTKRSRAATDTAASTNCKKGLYDYRIEITKNPYSIYTNPAGEVELISDKPTILSEFKIARYTCADNSFGKFELDITVEDEKILETLNSICDNYSKCSPIHMMDPDPTGIPVGTVYCEPIVDELDNAIANSNSCISDNDCAIVPLPGSSKYNQIKPCMYPSTYINKKYLSEVDQIVQKLQVDSKCIIKPQTQQKCLNSAGNSYVKCLTTPSSEPKCNHNCSTLGKCIKGKCSSPEKCLTN